MNTTLWYLTNKLDASFPSFFLIPFFLDTLCYAAVISMCVKREKSVG